MSSRPLRLSVDSEYGERQRCYARQSNPNAVWEKRLKPQLSWIQIFTYASFGLVCAVTAAMLYVWGI